MQQRAVESTQSPNISSNHYCAERKKSRTDENQQQDGGVGDVGVIIDDDNPENNATEIDGADDTHDSYGEILFYKGIQQVKRWIFLLLVGFLPASYWRGLWTLVDIYTCASTNTNASDVATLFNGQLFCLTPDYALYPNRRRNNAWVSYAVGLCLIGMGQMLFHRGWFQQKQRMQQQLENGQAVAQASPKKKWVVSATRIITVQCMGMGFVLGWRGVWMLTDYYWTYPNNNAIQIAWLSTMVGLVGCLLLQCSASLVAAPAGVLDDPSLASFETVYSGIRRARSISINVILPQQQRQHQHKNPIIQAVSWIVDGFVSYVVLICLELWFWRGIWTLQDHYFWGYTASRDDLHLSLGMGMVIFGSCVTTSQAIQVVFLTRNTAALVFLGSRIQNILLGVASVSFWRVVWYVWEHFLGGATLSSAWVAHLIGVAGSITLGCFASVIFSPVVDIMKVSSTPNECDEAAPTAAATRKISPQIRWFAIARHHPT